MHLIGKEIDLLEHYPKSKRDLSKRLDNKTEEAREIAESRTGRKTKVPKFERDEEGRIKDTPRAEEFDMDAYEERIRQGKDDYDYGEYTP